MHDKHFYFSMRDLNPIIVHKLVSCHFDFKQIIFIIIFFFTFFSFSCFFFFFAIIFQFCPFQYYVYSATTIKLTFSKVINNNSKKKKNQTNSSVFFGNQDKFKYQMPLYDVQVLYVYS